MENQLRLSAPAKINLYLKVTGRRPDGYHDLATLMQKIDLCDELLLQTCKTGIQLSCPDSSLPENRDNLVFKAAQLFLASLEERLGGEERGVRMTLYKKIPAAAGLGGGSSDAAAVLLGLNELFSTNCTTEELVSLAVQLGADVPFFVFGHAAAWATGIGEKLTPAVSLTKYHLLVVNPGFPVATQWVFKNFRLTVDEKKDSLDCCHCSKRKSDFSVLAETFSRRVIQPMELENDLESVTTERYPEVNRLKKKLLNHGAVGAMMSGSGPTVFGLFAESDFSAVENCYNDLKKDYENTFLVQSVS